MNASRIFACCSAAIFLLSACSSFPSNGIDDDLPTDEESEAARLRHNRDDVAVRLVEVLPIEAEGSSRFTAEVLGILGSYGDGRVARPELNVVAGPSVTFTSVPEGCTVVPAGVDCIVDTLLFDSGGLLTETDTLPFEFEYSIAQDAQLPVVFELSASSFENPVSNDPVPENNILTIEAS